MAKVFRLEDMEVQEVSLVDRAANQEKFLIVKRDTNMFGVRDLAAEVVAEEEAAKAKTLAKAEMPAEEKLKDEETEKAQSVDGTAGKPKEETPPVKPSPEDEIPAKKAEEEAEEEDAEKAADPEAEVEEEEAEAEEEEAEKAEDSAEEEKPEEEKPAEKAGEEPATPAAEQPPAEGEEPAGEGGGSLLQLAVETLEALTELVEGLAGAGFMKAAQKAAIGAKIAESAEALGKAMNMPGEVKAELTKGLVELQEQHKALSAQVDTLKKSDVAKSATADIAKELTALKATVAKQEKQIAKLSKRVPAASSEGGEKVEKGASADDMKGLFPADYNA